MAKAPNAPQSTDPEIDQLRNLVRGFNAWKWVFAGIAGVIGAGVAWTGNKVYESTLALKGLEPIPASVKSIDDRLQGVETSLGGLKDVGQQIAKLDRLADQLDSFKTFEIKLSKVADAPQKIETTANELKKTIAILDGLGQQVERFKTELSEIQKGLIAASTAGKESAGKVDDIQKKLNAQIVASRNVRNESIAVQVTLNKAAEEYGEGSNKAIIFRVAEPTIAGKLHDVLVRSVDVKAATSRQLPPFSVSAIAEPDGIVVITLTVGEEINLFKEFISKGELTAKIEVTGLR